MTNIEESTQHDGLNQSAEEEVDLFPALTWAYNHLTSEVVERIACVVLIIWAILPVIATAVDLVCAVGKTSSRGLIESNYIMVFNILGAVTVIIACVLFVRLLIATRGHIVESAKRYPWLILLVVLFIWAFICASLSGHFDFEWAGSSYRHDGLTSYFVYAAVLVCAFLLCSERRKLLLLRVFGIAANVIALIVLLQVFDVHPISDMMPVGGAGPTGPFSQFNHTGYYLLMTIAALVGLLLYDRKRSWQIAYALSLAFQTYALVKNDTFGCILASWVALVFIYVVYFVRREPRNWIAALPIICMVVPSMMSFDSLSKNVLGFFTDVNQVASDSSSDAANNAGTGRLVLWKFAIEQIAENPVFGVGPEGLVFKVHDGIVDRPHNEYLQYAAFFGIPGILLYLSSLITLAVNKLRRIKILAPTTVIVAGVIVAYAISACFGNTMFYTSPYFFMMIGLVSRHLKHESVHNLEQEPTQEPVECASQN